MKQGHLRESFCVFDLLALLDAVLVVAQEVGLAFVPPVLPFSPFLLAP